MTLRKASKELTKGVIDALAYTACFMLIALMILNYFDYGTDPTDLNGFHRSGLHYYKDYGTGIEYIAGPDGKLIERPKINP